MKPGHFRRLRNSTREMEDSMNVKRKSASGAQKRSQCKRERLHTGAVPIAGQPYRTLQIRATHLASPAGLTASHVPHPGSQRWFFFPQNITFPATCRRPASPSSDVIDVIHLVASGQVQLQSRRRSRVGVDERWLQGIRGGGHTRPRISFRAFRRDARSICRGSQANYSSIGRGQTQPRAQPDP